MKSFKISINEKDINAVRDSFNVIKLILSVSSHIVNLPVSDFYYQDPDHPIPYVVLCTSKNMNRLVWGDSSSQLHSVHFPFSITDNATHLELHYHSIEINSQVIQALKKLFISENTYFSLDSLLDEFIEIFSDFGLSQLQQQELWELYQHLFSFEICYLRYDYDPQHENGQIHPLHHLDINFSNMGTYKLGLNSNMELSMFLDLLDTETNCKYISIC